MFEFHPGVKPNDPSKARLYFRMFRQAGAVAPASADYTEFSPIGMLGNDQYGDCVEAANGHIVEQQTFFGQGSEVAVSADSVLAEYSRITGFNPNDPNTDRGTMIQDGLDDLRKIGFSGHTVAAFAQLDVKNLNDVKLAVAEFGAVAIGFNFPSSAMSQFNAGQPWTVVNGSPIEGGHCVLVTGYDADYLYVVTWGAIQKMGYDFWNAYVDEAWAIIDQDWVNNASGKDVEGVDLQAFGAQYAALTGQPNPFPAPTPVPVPTPTPVPTPVPVPMPVVLDPAELALVSAAKRYLASFAPRSYLAKALRAWLADKEQS